MATRPLPLEPRGAAEPFVKWAGGKRSVLERIDAQGLLPQASTFETYWEPFLGGGACFFRLRPKRAILSDTNEDLITAYRVIQQDPTELIELLRNHERGHGTTEPQRQAYYYRVRSLNPAKMSSAERAARFIYLNKTCFNGLYRVNASGQFNVPLGSYRSPMICDSANLWRVHHALDGAKLILSDFRALPKAASGDFVYCDPPYHPLSATSSFTSYTAGDFGAQDQRDLADWARAAADRGANVLVSNSATPFIRALYEPRGFAIASIQAGRAINSKATARGPIEEFAITSYPRPHRQRTPVGAGSPSAVNGTTSKK